MDTVYAHHYKRRKGGSLAISLSNLNPQNHLGIALGNMRCMDPPPPTPLNVGMEMTNTKQTMPDTTIEPWYQAKNVTLNIGRLMEALDRERLDIAQALDILMFVLYMSIFYGRFMFPWRLP